jgi:inorganic triphosphatase YgiF
MRDEFELKLALSPQQLAALPRNSFLRALVQQQEAPKRLVSTYYDTPARLLYKRAMALRVRRSGRDRIQTLKVKANGTSGLQHFQEYEAAVSGDRPDLNRIEDPDLKALFLETGLAAEIAPVFTTDFARRKFLIRLFESEIELALDRGSIKVGDASTPICEAELELISGRPARLYELALALQDSVPFGLEFRTKAGRGYALAMNAPASPLFGERPELSPDMTAGQAFQAIARACRDQIQGNEPAVRAGPGPGHDPEGVHQMRVGIRRLRAVLRAFRAILQPRALEYLKQELRWMQQELGPARDWDVFLSETLPPIRQAMAQEAGFESLASAAEASRRRAYDRAVSAVADKRFVRLLLQLNLWLEDGSILLRSGTMVQANGVETPPSDPTSIPILGFAGDVLRRCDRRLRRAGKRSEELTLDDLHELRIEAKKIRYAIEFFKSLYPQGPVKKHVKRLVEIQDCLGAVNDSAMCHDLLKELRVGAALGADFSKPLTERALGLIAGWQAATMRERTKNFATLWADYRKAKAFWT